jgi:hypothetical protein
VKATLDTPANEPQRLGAAAFRKLCCGFTKETYCLEDLAIGGFRVLT